MHYNSELLFRKYSLSYFNSGLKVLEIGPAGHPTAYQQVVNNSDIIWHTIDYPESVYIAGANQSLTYHISDPYNYPVQDNMYDIVLSGQVIEHIEDIWRWMSELKRIVKPGGYIITINPVSWPYHEAPIDCWRIFPNGIKVIAKNNGLEVVQNLFESLEEGIIKERFSNQVCIPGRSYNYINTERQVSLIIWWNRIISLIPLVKNALNVPLEVAYDTISILRKP